MKWPIPEARPSEEAWRCVQLRWPDDPYWMAILAGALHEVARGRSWDENTGTVTEIRDYGIRVFEENFPFVSCSGETLEPGGIAELIDGGYISGCGCDDCEDCMSGCCLTDLRWNAGNLEMYRCGKWETVLGANGEPANAGGVGSAGVQIPETGETGSLETPELPPGAVENIDCRKAYVLADAMWEVATVIDSKTDVIPVLREWRIIQALPQYTLNYVFVAEAATMLMVVEGLETLDFADAFDANEKQRLTCWLQQIMRDEYGMGTDEWPGLVLSFAGYNGLDLDAEGFIMGLFWQKVLEAMGYGTVNEICKSAQALDIEPDCACPGELGEQPIDRIPDGLDWAFVIDFTEDSWSFTPIVNTSYSAGEGFVSSHVVGDDMFMASAARQRETPAGDPNDTKVHYIEVHSSEWPTGYDEVRSGGVWATWIDSGATTTCADPNLPVRSRYDRYFPSGAPWGENNGMNMFTAFALRGDVAPTGRHVVSMLVIAGTGAVPYGDLDNLLA